jgi:transcriptional regulator
MSWGAVADNSAEDLELLQGTLDVLILKTLSWGPRHGYAIARWVHDVSDDVLRVEEGALYPALHRLEKRGLIEAEWGLSENNRKAKYYQLTTLGRAQLQAKATTWERYSAAVSKVLAVG